MSFRSFIQAMSLSLVFASGGVTYAQAQASAGAMSPGTVAHDETTNNKTARPKMTPAGIGHTNMAGDTSHGYMSSNNSMAKKQTGMMMKKDAASSAQDISNTHAEESNNSQD
ncbi:hypothetical protein AA23498_2821 [Acetobacter nitrogenifigens DSM 23921 = NBRC 105050]|uniref:Pentapeptide MXKDX repeat protein n=1 Tax=Acetobacter nitrogenifigens DSM 23921 = NBRC 105050 TaxID=1120919 RepID=A0A511XDJ5_9PROT|nr:hypothetical protein [Acetobacter nitrogenifigens]GBQ97179.1 hypothetical protein AA23498_2821 [Acetobacter nitrogenifigens DSM 23921 = NBRC 105050]GEN60971.1 hypothetical protein ANI02nite_28550 [Acetobacter nitrogenifigens DSM 23921 = NBRC 105050]